MNRSLGGLKALRTQARGARPALALASSLPGSPSHSLDTRFYASPSGDVAEKEKSHARAKNEKSKQKGQPSRIPRFALWRKLEKKKRFEEKGRQGREEERDVSGTQKLDRIAQEDNQRTGDMPLKRTKERANPFVMTPEERQKLTLADYEAYLKYLLSWKRFDVDLRPKEILEIVLNEKIQISTKFLIRLTIFVAHLDKVEESRVLYFLTRLTFFLDIVSSVFQTSGLKGLPQRTEFTRTNSSSPNDETSVQAEAPTNGESDETETLDPNEKQSEKTENGNEDDVVEESFSGATAIAAAVSEDLASNMDPSSDAQGLRARVRHSRAFEMLEFYEKVGVKPMPDALSFMLWGCAGANNLEEGRKVWHTFRSLYDEYYRSEPPAPLSADALKKEKAKKAVELEEKKNTVESSLTENKDNNVSLSEKKEGESGASEFGLDTEGATEGITDENRDEKDYEDDESKTISVRVKGTKDWQCKNCNYFNFSVRNVCKLCLHPRPVETEEEVLSRYPAIFPGTYCKGCGTRFPLMAMKCNYCGTPRMKLKYIPDLRMASALLSLAHRHGAHDLFGILDVLCVSAKIDYGLAFNSILVLCFINVQGLLFYGDKWMRRILEAGHEPHPMVLSHYFSSGLKFRNVVAIQTVYNYKYADPNGAKITFGEGLRILEAMVKAPMRLSLAERVHARLHELYGDVELFREDMRAADNALTMIYARAFMWSSMFDHVGKWYGLQEDIAPTKYYELLATALAYGHITSISHVAEAYRILQERLQSGKVVTVLMLNALLKACAKMGNLDLAYEIFSAFPSYNIKPTESSYEAMLDLCYVTQHPAYALEVVQHMELTGIQGSPKLYEKVMKPFTAPDRPVDLTIQVMDRLISIVGKPTYHTFHLVVNFLIASGAMDAANRYVNIAKEHGHPIDRLQDLLDKPTDTKVKFDTKRREWRKTKARGLNFKADKLGANISADESSSARAAL